MTDHSQIILIAYIIDKPEFSSAIPSGMRLNALRHVKQTVKLHLSVYMCRCCN
jgi:hypothetical protein